MVKTPPLMRKDLWDIPPEENFFFSTKDRVKLAITRYRPRCFIPHREPVILCPGVACNRYFYDLDKQHSLARYLQQGGFDVWSLELRGYGLSERPRIWDFGKWNWNVDVFIEYDVPAAVDFVRQRTGMDQVFWIGHSMGVAVIYGYMIRHDQTKIKGVVGLGGFGLFGGNELVMRLFRWGGVFRFLFFKNQPIPIDALADFLSRLPAKRFFYRNTMFNLIFTPENMEPRVTARFFRNVLTDTPANVLRQFFLCARHQDFLTFDGSYSYAEHHHVVNRPILCVAGENDQLVTPNNVLNVFQRLSSKDKTYLLLSQANGFAADYGHADILLGRRARFEVYPLIDLWLREHADG